MESAKKDRLFPPTIHNALRRERNTKLKVESVSVDPASKHGPSFVVIIIVAAAIARRCSGMLPPLPAGALITVCPYLELASRRRRYIGQSPM